MSALVPPGAGCAGLGRGRYQQGLGEGGSCQTKPSLNRNSSGGPGLGQEPDRHQGPGIESSVRLTA